jgi:hypothetical protein
VQLEPKIAVSKKLNKDKRKARAIAVVDKKHAPLVPIKRPKRIQVKKLKKGKINIHRYIT